MEINLSNSLIAKKRLLRRQTENRVPLRMKLKKKHTIHMLDYISHRYLGFPAHQ